jgi:holin-like protein
MLKTLLLLLSCLLGAEAIRAATSISFPAPLIGLFVLTLLLGARPQGASVELAEAGRSLIDHMGLLFVPAGVGVMAQFDLLKHEWMPIMVALIGSTLIGVAITGVVMHWLLGLPPNVATSPN